MIPRVRLVALILLGVGLVVLAGARLFGIGEAAAAPSANPETCATSPDSEVCLDEEPLPSITSVEPLPTTAAATLESAAHAASRFASRPQFMMYADSEALLELVDTDTTGAGRSDLMALTRKELVTVREALATAPPASTWFVVRPLTTSVTNLDVEVGTAEASVWSTQIFSRVGVGDPEQSFTVTDMSLVFNGERWLLDGFASRPGPAARLGSEQFPVTAPELETRLDGHRILDPYVLTLQDVR